MVAEFMNTTGVLDSTTKVPEMVGKPGRPRLTGSVRTSWLPLYTSIS